MDSNFHDLPLPSPPKKQETENSENKNKKVEIKYDKGILHLPTGEQFRIKVQSNKKPIDLTQEQGEHIAQLLGKSELNPKDLAHTRITHEGVFIGKEEDTIESEGVISENVLRGSKKTENFVGSHAILNKDIVGEFTDFLTKIAQTANKTSSHSQNVFDQVSINFEEQKLDNQVSKEVPNEKTSKKTGNIFRSLSQKFEKLSFKDLKRNLSQKFEPLKTKISSLTTKISDGSKIRNSSLAEIKTQLDLLVKPNNALRISDGKIRVIEKEPLSISFGPTTKDVVREILAKLKNEMPVISEESTPEKILKALNTLKDIQEILTSLKNNENPSLKKAFEGKGELKESLEKLEVSSNIEQFSKKISTILEKVKDNIFQRVNDLNQLGADLEELQLVDKIIQEMGDSLKSNIKNWSFADKKEDFSSLVSELSKNALNKDNTNNKVFSIELIKLLNANRWTKALLSDNNEFTNFINQDNQQRIEKLFGSPFDYKKEFNISGFLDDYRNHMTSSEMFTVLKNQFLEIDKIIKLAQSANDDQGEIKLLINGEQNSVNQKNFIENLRNKQGAILDLCVAWAKNPNIHQGELGKVNALVELNIQARDISNYILDKFQDVFHGKISNIEKAISGGEFKFPEPSKSPEIIIPPEIKELKVENKVESREKEMIKEMSFDQIRKLFETKHTENQKLRTGETGLEWVSRHKVGNAGKKQKTIDLVEGVLSKITDEQISLLSVNAEKLTTDEINKIIKRFSDINFFLKSINEDPSNSWIQEVIQNPKNKALAFQLEGINNNSMPDGVMNIMLNKISSQQNDLISKLNLKNLSHDDSIKHLNDLNNIKKSLNNLALNPGSFGINKLKGQGLKDWENIQKFPGLDEGVSNILSLVEKSLQESEHIKGLHEQNSKNFEKSLQTLSKIESILSFIESEQLSKEIKEHPVLKNQIVKINELKSEGLKKVTEPKEKISNMVEEAKSNIQKALEKLGSPLNSKQLKTTEHQTEVAKLNSAKQFLSSIKNSSWTNPKNGLYSEEDKINLVKSCNESRDQIENFESLQRLSEELHKVLDTKDTNSLKSFLFTYRDYWSTKVLFEGLKERFNSTDNPQEKENILNLCKEWLEDPFVQTEQDKKDVLQIMGKFEKSTHSTEVSNLINQGEKVEPPIKKDSYQPVSKSELHYAKELSKLTSSKKMNDEKRKNLLEIFSEDLFKQDAYLLSQINVEEMFLYNSAERDPNKQIAWKSMNALANVSNYESNYALLAIITGNRPKERSNRMEFFIDLCSECVKKGNFNAAYQIMSALNNTAITSLLGKSKKLPLSSDYQEKLNELNNLFSSSSKYKNLNEEIAKYKKNENAPYIPVIPFITQELDSVKNVRERLIDGKIDTDRRELAYNIINKFIEPQTRIGKPNATFKPTTDITKELEQCASKEGKQGLMKNFAKEEKRSGFTEFSQDQEVLDIGDITTYASKVSKKIREKK